MALARRETRFERRKLRQARNRKHLGEVLAGRLVVAEIEGKAAWIEHCPPELIRGTASGQISGLSLPRFSRNLAQNSGETAANQRVAIFSDPPVSLG